MSIPVYDRIFSNPFEILGLHPSASERELRHRIDEIEMHASLGDESIDVPAIARARNELADASSRIVAELLTPWSGDPLYDPFAVHHDHALNATRTSLQRSTTPDQASLTEAMFGWMSVLGNPELASAMDSRFAELDIDGPAGAWMRRIVSISILPALVQHAVNTRTLKNNEILHVLAEISDFGVVSVDRAIQPIVEDYAAVLWFEKDRPLSPQQLTPMIEDFSNTFPMLQKLDREAWTRTAECLVVAVNATVGNLLEQDEIVPAGKLIASVDRLDLPAELKHRVHRDLRWLRYLWAWHEANEHASYGEWAYTIQALERARENADSEGDLAQVNEALGSAKWALSTRQRGKKSRPVSYVRTESAPRRSDPPVTFTWIKSIRAWVAGSSKKQKSVLGAVIIVFLVLTGTWYFDRVELTRAEARYEQGLVAFEIGDFDSAIAHFEAARRDHRAEDMLGRTIEVQHASAAYRRGMDAKDDERWDAAEVAFQEAGTYSDALRQLEEVQRAKSYTEGLRLLDDGLFSEAEEAFLAADGYEDSEEQLERIDSLILYEQGVELSASAEEATDPEDRLELLLLASDRYEEAGEHLDVDAEVGNIEEDIELTEAWLAGIEAEASEDFVAAEELYLEAGQEALAESVAGAASQQRHYEAGRDAEDSEDYATAHDKYVKAGSFRDASSRAQEIDEMLALEEAYAAGVAALELEDWDSAINHFTAAGDFKDADQRKAEAETSRHHEAMYGSAVAALNEGRFVDAHDVLSEIHSVRSSYADVGALIERIESTVASPIVFDLGMLNEGNDWSTTVWVTNVLGENLFELQFSRTWSHVDNNSLVLGVQVYPVDGFEIAFGLLPELHEEASSTIWRTEHVAGWGETYTGLVWNGYQVSAHIPSLNVEWNPTLYGDYYYPGAVFRSLVIEVTLAR